jgi:hypothetical protein
MIRLQEKIFACVRLLAEGNAAGKELDKICDFVQKEVNICIPYDFWDFPLSERQSLLFGWLNRPIRVCGMVVNEGEPGGGPFWVDDPDGKGGASLQIIEESQINHADPKQRAVWSSATHFNPVDIVCGVRDFCGRKFDLMSFVDPATVVITRKSEKGRELLALEKPGLWNGSMAFWNTVFIEVPSQPSIRSRPSMICCVRSTCSRLSRKTISTLCLNEHLRSDEQAFRIFRHYGWNLERRHDSFPKTKNGCLVVPGSVAVADAKTGRQTPRLFIAASGNQDGRSGKVLDPDERIARLSQPLDCAVVAGVSSDHGLRRFGESEMSPDLQEFDVPKPIFRMPVEEVSETPGENGIGQKATAGGRRV